MRAAVVCSGGGGSGRWGERGLGTLIKCLHCSWPVCVRSFAATSWYHLSVPALGGRRDCLFTGSDPLIYCVNKSRCPRPGGGGCGCWLTSTIHPTQLKEYCLEFIGKHLHVAEVVATQVWQLLGTHPKLLQELLARSTRVFSPTRGAGEGS